MLIVARIDGRAMSQIRFLPKNRAIPVQGQESVLQVAVDNHVELEHSCGGMGSCGTCRVFVESNLDQLPARNGVEKEMAEARGFDACERLACQLEPIDDLVVRIPNLHKMDL